jgi:hypothetical protein
MINTYRKQQQRSVATPLALFYSFDYSLSHVYKFIISLPTIPSQREMSSETFVRYILVVPVVWDDNEGDRNDATE